MHFGETNPIGARLENWSSELPKAGSQAAAVQADRKHSGLSPTTASRILRRTHVSYLSDWTWA
jgi:hypothetical protein